MNITSSIDRKDYHVLHDALIFSLRSGFILAAQIFLKAILGSILLLRSQVIHKAPARFPEVQCIRIGWSVFSIILINLERCS